MSAASEIDTNERGECEKHMVFPATSCTICSGADVRRNTQQAQMALSAFEIEYLFTAKFHPMCAECDQVMKPGGIVCHLTDGRNVCGDCGGVQE